jgi:transcriptional regulator with XRE-family HTH domain
MTAKRMTARKFLAREIKIARETKGISRDKLARAVYVSEGLVRAWETARRLPQVDQLKLVDEVLGTNGYLQRMREDLIKNEPVPEYMDRWIEIEQTARTAVTYQPLLVPGLFQTPEYAREVFKDTGRQIDDIDESVEARIDRQKILDPDHGLVMVAIIDECVLDRPIGGKEVMYGQMLRLLEFAAQPNVEIQIVPMNTGFYSGLSGGFIIATMDGKEYAYVDDTFSGDVLEDPDEVAAIQRLWVALSVQAMPAKQSIERIEQAVEKWKP